MSVFDTWLGTDVTLPLDYSVAANWNTVGGVNAIPAAGYFVYFQNTGNNVEAGLNQSAVVLALFQTADTFVGNIGTVGLAGSYLQIASPLVYLGLPGNGGSPGGGSPLLKINIGSGTTCEMTIFSTGQSSVEDGLEPTRILGNKSTHVINVNSGLVGLATSVPGETSVFGTLNVLGGQVDASSGVTITTIKQYGGAVFWQGIATTYSIQGGSLATVGTNAITTINVNGTAVLSSTGTVTTLNCYPGSQVDFNQSLMPRQVTTINVYRSSSVSIGSHITNNGSTTSINFIGCAPNDGSTNFEWIGPGTYTAVITGLT